MSKPNIPIALIDDHTLVRKGLVGLVESLGGYHVAVEASNGKEFIERVTEGAEVALALVDLKMPVMDGFETMKWVKIHAPAIRCIALTFENSESAVLNAVRSGARGFLLKDIEPTELKSALDTVLSTGYYHTDLVNQSMMQDPHRLTGREQTHMEVLARFTERELVFIRHSCSPDEPTYEEVADSMTISRRTVDGYRTSVFQKCGVHSKTGMVLFAARWGIVKL